MRGWNFEMQSQYRGTLSNAQVPGSFCSKTNHLVGKPWGTSDFVHCFAHGISVFWAKQTITSNRMEKLSAHSGSPGYSFVQCSSVASQSYFSRSGRAVLWIISHDLWLILQIVQLHQVFLCYKATWYNWMSTVTAPCTRNIRIYYKWNNIVDMQWSIDLVVTVGILRGCATGWGAATRRKRRRRNGRSWRRRPRRLCHSSHHWWSHEAGRTRPSRLPSGRPLRRPQHSGCVWVDAAHLQHVK